MKPFTIIICTYNSENRILRIIDSILKQNDYNSLVNDFLIVDNNSTDTTKDLILQYSNQITYCFEKQQGLSFARQHGVIKTKSPWIIFIDDDNILEQNWLINANEFIKVNYNLGAFNGAILPLIEFKMTNEERLFLHACFRALACTNLEKNDIPPSTATNCTPVGAGLVIRSQPLKELNELGWLKSTGRKGAELVSGEDTEMVLYVKTCGYSLGFCNSMFLNHLIDKSRLTYDYINALYLGFVPLILAAIKKKYNHIYFIILLKSIIVNSIRYLSYKYLLRRPVKTLSAKLNLRCYYYAMISILKKPNR